MADGRVEIDVNVNSSQVQPAMNSAANSVQRAAEQMQQSGNTVSQSAERMSADMAAAFQSVVAQTSRTAVGVESLGTAMQQVTGGMAAQTTATQELGTQMQQLSAAFSASLGAIGRLQSALNAISQDMERLVLTTDHMSRALDQINESGPVPDEGAKISKVGSVFKGLGKAMLGAAAAAGTAAVALGKSAVSAYADYEQLVGGVETLFGAGGQSLEEYAESQGKSVDKVRAEYESLMNAQSTVFANADKAFATAGLSANEYMETATGFAASLVSSLGGDTQKAAEKADTAITDMADNANKMGSDMESIQNAYQGFAKSNFTMLDNLKIGYGGTKEEMERLLDDAGKLQSEKLGTEVKFDISSYADIIDAIHVIQDEMGITGTTAKEAEGTISGSIASLQSAAQNLIAGLGNPDADIQGLCDTMVEAFRTAEENIELIIGNIIEALPNAADALIDAVGDLLPSMLSAFTGLFDKVLTALVEMLPKLAPAVADAAADAAVSIVDTIADNLPVIIEAVIQTVVSIANALTEALPRLIPTIVDGVLMAATALLENVDIILNAAVQLVVAFEEGIVNSFPDIIARLPELLLSLVNALTSLIPLLYEVPVKICKAIGEGLIEFDWKETSEKMFDGMLERLREQDQRVNSYFAELFHTLGWEAAAEWFEGANESAKYSVKYDSGSGGSGFDGGPSTPRKPKSTSPVTTGLLGAFDVDVPAREAEERLNKVTDEFKEDYENLQMMLINGDVSEGEEYFAALEDLLNKHNAKGLSAYNKYYKEIKDGRQKLLDDIAKEEEKRRKQEEKDAEQAEKEAENAEKKRVTAVKKATKEEISEAKKAVSEIVKAYQSEMKEVEKLISTYKKKLLSVGDVFETEKKTDKFGNTLTSYKIADIDKQIREMEDYDAKIRRLRDQGAGDGLISELMSKDMAEGAKYADYISKLTDEQRDKLFESYKKREELADKLSQEMYADKVSEIETDFISKIEESFGEMPEGMRELGSSAINSFIEGFAGEDIIGSVQDKAKEIFSALADAAENGVFNSLDSLINIDDGYYDALAEKVNAIVELQAAAVSSAISAKGVTVNVGDTSSAGGQGYTKADIDRLIAGINKPVSLELNGKQIAEFTIAYANGKSRVTGGATIK